MGGSPRGVVCLGPRGGRQLQLGPPTHWPGCLRSARLLLMALSAGVPRQRLDTFLYKLYAMYLAVRATLYAHTRSGVPRHGEALFPWRTTPGGGEGYPWQDLCGPMPRLLTVPAMRLCPGVPPAQAGYGNLCSPTTWSARRPPFNGQMAHGMSHGQNRPWIVSFSWFVPCRHPPTTNYGGCASHSENRRKCCGKHPGGCSTK